MRCWVGVRQGELYGRIAVMTAVKNVLCLEGKVIADDLYHLIRTIDRGAWRDDLEAAARTLLGRIETRLRAIMDRTGTDLIIRDRRIAALWMRLGTLAREVRRFCARHNLSASVSSRHWRTFLHRVSPIYQGIAASLRATEADVASLRPANHKRTLFHVASGLFSMLLFQHVLTGAQAIWVAGGFALICWMAELLRRSSNSASAAIMRIFNVVAHPREHHRIASATWFCTALFLLALTMPKMAATVALTVLTLADPAASLVGRRYGSILLRAGRSLQGTLAFTLTAAAASYGAMILYFPGIDPWIAGRLSVVAAVVGALAEFFSWRVDDNLSIPLSVGIAMTLCGWIML